MIAAHFSCSDCTSFHPATRDVHERAEAEAVEDRLLPLQVARSPLELLVRAAQALDHAQQPGGPALREGGAQAAREAHRSHVRGLRERASSGDGENPSSRWIQTCIADPSCSMQCPLGAMQTWPPMAGGSESTYEILCSFLTPLLRQSKIRNALKSGSKCDHF